MKLREKYSLQSFKGDKDDIVERLKQKTKQQTSPVEEFRGFSRSTSATERLGSEAKQ